MQLKRIFSLFLLFLGLVFKTLAQQYPVQVNAQLTPPYTLQVSDYYSPTTPGAEKLRLMLLNRDLMQQQLNVRLRLTIESNMVRLRSREDVVFPAITINSGVPYYVTPQELAPYFSIDNMELNGLSRLQYESNGKLPEGFYTFCIEVVDVATGKTLSNKGCAMAWMTLSDPPLLNLPRKSEAITPRTPQNILFQWTPRHTASPIAGMTTDYVFSMVEILDSTLTPDAAFATYTPFYTDSVSITTTYLYDAAKPALIPGKRYAWRIQAKTKQGLEDIAAFRNSGYSETSWFLYKNTCPTPSGIQAIKQGQNAIIQWQSNEQHLEYKLEYRESGNGDAVWFTATNTIPHIMLTDIKPSKQYEYRVGRACEFGTFNYSNLFSFTSNDSTISNVEYCGDTSSIPSTIGMTMLSVLNPGDTIKAGDFNVIVTQSTGSGSFSGQGYVKVPWLANVNVAVRFEGVGVNTQKQLALGKILTSYDPTESGLVEIKEILNDIKGSVGIITELINIAIDKDYREIKKLIEGLKSIIETELPEQFANEIKENLLKIEVAKQGYDEAKSLYESLPEGVEKNNAKAAIEQKKLDYEKAQSNLNVLNDKKNRIIGDLSKVIAQSIQEIKVAYADSLNLTKSQIQALYDELKPQLITSQELSLDEEETLNDIEMMVIDEFYQEIKINQIPSELQPTFESINSYSEKAKYYKVLKLAILLSEFYKTDKEVGKFFSDDILIEGKKLIRELIEKYKPETEKATLIEFTKNYIKTTLFVIIDTNE